MRLDQNYSVELDKRDGVAAAVALGTGIVGPPLLCMLLGVEGMGTFVSMLAGIPTALSGVLMGKFVPSDLSTMGRAKLGTLVAVFTAGLALPGFLTVKPSLMVEHEIQAAKAEAAAQQLAP